jgi:hypothetical protein
LEEEAGPMGYLKPKTGSQASIFSVSYVWANMSLPVRAGSLSADVCSAGLTEDLRLLCSVVEEIFSDERHLFGCL